MSALALATAKKDVTARRGIDRGAHKNSAPTPTSFSNAPLLQRKSRCACGGDCPRCSNELDLEKVVQTKLVVGEPQDEYEREADQIADHVMRVSATAHVYAPLSLPSPVNTYGTMPVQRKPATTAPLLKVQRQAEALVEPLTEEEEEPEEIIQTKLIAGKIGPPTRLTNLFATTIQRQSYAGKQNAEAKDEDESDFPDVFGDIAAVQAKFAPDAQSLPVDQDGSASQPIETFDDEHSVRRKGRGGEARRNQWHQTQEAFSPVHSVEQAIHRTRGGGIPLLASTQHFMEDSFGVDFGHVRIHTSAEAEELNQLLHSYAFTTGSDIYFATGMY
ncbi:MAG TPA: DUF4157 domain-containing protein, partial [Pyrinomonadaceae bacterium]|nr:DUF4157 domain-containing protein [Pyrinomonadaceae bacterium]